MSKQQFVPRRRAQRAMSLMAAIGATLASVASAQQAGPAPTPKAAESGSLEEVIVTGSRIRRAETDTSAPLVVVGSQDMSDRGYVSAAQAINTLTSANPALNLASGGGASSGPGQQFPALFGLGSGRTLTLVNGRRFVTSSSGLGDSQVDANVIPVGLIDHIDVVQAGNAAVYGSDAIAGVVNYVLKKNFEGVEFDAQTGNASEGDYAEHTVRATFGTNFAQDRGNIAANVEWAKSPELYFSDRDLTNLARITTSNSADTGPNDGIPSLREVLDAHFWNFNYGGVIYNTPAPVPAFLTRLNGVPQQFSSTGEVITYDPGTILGVPFAEHGQGFRYSDLTGLRTAVERSNVNVLGHYDINERVKVSGELLYARTKGTEVPQGESRTVLNSAASGAGPIMFTKNNPFLSPTAIATLSQASATFANGGPLWLSKYFLDLVPDARQETTTETYRGLIGLDGDFTVGNRDYYWSVSGSYGRVEGEQRAWNVLNARYNSAINSTRNAAGAIVCSINADANTTNDDPACAPLNPFGGVSQAARDYVATEAGTDYTNKQVDFLATLGGSLYEMPTGDLKFSVAYEHRKEDVEFIPLPANQLGLIDTGARTLPQSGSYNTNELAGELLIPLVGNEFTLPLVQELELSAAYRYVDNSAAGTEDVWNAGLRWNMGEGFTLRASRGRNFRAPTLAQLYAPASTTLTNSGADPCDADRINGGPNPTVRRANCEALFAANPQYGPLATFQDPAENFSRTTVTTGGNQALENEISDTLTYGFVFQPTFVDNLAFTFDRIEIDLENGLSAFTTENFTATCYDNSPQPAAICSVFTRLSQPDGVSPAGTIVTGRTTTVNAGVVKYRGEVYAVSYGVPLEAMISGDPGSLLITVDATHNVLLTTSVTGTTFTRTDNTVAEPTWVGRLDLRYTRGPLRLTWVTYYLDETRAAPDVTIETNPNPILDSNIRHDLSGQYDFGNWTLRAGVSNLTNKEPSYPNFQYGDIIGRRYFVGANVRF